MKTFDSIEGMLSRADQSVDYRTLWIFLSLLFALLFLWRPWNGNEEHYFLLAYRTFSPGSVSPFHSAFDQSSARFLVEYAIGWLVSSFGYDVAHVALRTAQVFIYSTGFTVLFHALQLSVLSSLATIGLFVYFGEQLYGGEWLFRGVEAKTFAYGAAVAAVGMSIRSKWITATILMAIATWLHFLVGGFWMVTLAVFALISKKQIALPLKLVGYYSLLVLPLVIAIGIEQFGQSLPSTSPSPTEIYVQRNTHHIAPFFGTISQWRFWEWGEGIVATLLTFLAIAIFLPYARNQDFLKLIFFLLLYLLAALAISFIDRSTFFTSKFYLFRPSSLTLLLAIAAALSEIQHDGSRRSLLMRQLPLMVFLLLFIGAQVKALAIHAVRPDRLDLQDLVAAVEQHSLPGEIALTQPSAGGFDDLDVFLPRQLHRPTLVSYKFVPTFPPMLVRWNILNEKSEAVFAGDCGALSNYPVSLLVVGNNETLENVRRCGSIVWQEGEYAIVSLSERS